MTTTDEKKQIFDTIQSVLHIHRISYPNIAAILQLPNGPFESEETFAQWLQKLLDGKTKFVPINEHHPTDMLIREHKSIRIAMSEAIAAEPDGIWAMMDKIYFQYTGMELLAVYLETHPAAKDAIMPILTKAVTKNQNK